MSSSRQTRRGCTNSGSVSKKRISSNKVIPGEDEFLKMIELAEYENNVDPYRGIQLLCKRKIDRESERQNINVKESKCWWSFNCSMRHEIQSTPVSLVLQDTQTSTDSTGTSEIIDVCGSNEERLRLITGCACPTLLKWMESARLKDEKLAANRKRKRTSNSNSSSSGYFGRQQSADVSRECACDYNPFCIVTLGGAMDEILEAWVKERSNTKESQSDVEFDDDIIVLEDSSTGTTMETLTNTFRLDDLTVDIFKPITLERLKEVRKCTDVDETSIRLHLGKLLPGLTTALSIDEGVDQIRHLHHTLVFSNPVVSNKRTAKKNTESSENQLLRLSMPPGIENLGATCYLNTQLQCLAQNLVFVDGIMSWRPSTRNDGDRMTSVLALFQDLLLRMNSGPHSTVNTLEFSNALGLDHFEQQDPNEFSRLFFDRLHDSFQGSENSKDLADLLPRLFQGVIAYETTCLVCGTKSKRTEEFMDLNLPIVRRRQNKVDTSQTKFDAEVQNCLNEYCGDEMFDGENQYHCSNCDRKCDAKRSLSFQTLPPVLNVQLCRYVFNREKHMKTKLNDRVLLPLHLDVMSLNESQSADSIKNKYYLCAIMRHKGTSAYSGHYVAEAMDWRSGQWFEFNDACVIHLFKGSSCSYDPCSVDLEDFGTDSNYKINGLIGSADAYNMYYVEESFLAHCSLEKLRKRADPPIESSSMSNERSKFYEELRQMCLHDERVMNQLQLRRQKLCTAMLPKLTSFDVTSSSNMVWVETSFLRQFLSCKELLTEPSGDRAILSHGELLCPHETPGLCPRIARKGKLIHKGAYDVFIEIIQEEIHSVHGRDISTEEVNDWAIIPSDNLICYDCIQEYRKELVAKLSLANSLKFLFDELDPKEFRFSRNVPAGETIGEGGDQYAYMVSRKFITWFRNKTMRFMKQASLTKKDPKVQSDLSVPLFSVEVGLDGLDFEEFSNLTLPSGNIEDEGISVRVNGPLTCRHGNFKSNISANSYMYVSCSVWKTINKMYPAAIEHKRRRLQSSEELENSSADDDDIFGCMQCNDEDASKSYMKRNVVDFARYCQKVQPITVLTLDEVTLRTLSTNRARYYLIALNEFTTWNKVLSLLSRKDVEKGDQSLKQLAEKIMLNGISEHSPGCLLTDVDKKNLSVDDLKRVDLLFLFFRSHVCDAHGLQVYDALFRDVVLRKEPFELSDNFFVMPENDYRQYLSYVGATVVLLCLADIANVWKECTKDYLIAEGANFFGRVKSPTAFHPLCVSGPSESPEIVGKQFVVGNALFRLQEGSCHSETCRQAYRNRDVSEKVSGVAEDPIDVDDELKPGASASPTVCVKVLDVRTNSDLSSILTMLASVDGVSNSDVQVCDQYYSRRSTRKRTSRYCFGDVLDEETIQVNLDNNVAALRLLLLERCTKGTEFELHHDLKVVLMSKFKTDDKTAVPVAGENNGTMLTVIDTEPLFKMIDLSSSVNTTTLRDLCEECLGAPHDASITTFLIRQAIVEQSTEKIPRDELMDTLLSLSNASNDVKIGVDAKSKKKRTEKGFIGTFLSLAPAPKPDVIIDTSDFAKSIRPNHISDLKNCTDLHSEAYVDVVPMSHEQDMFDSLSTSDCKRPANDSTMSSSINHSNITSETKKNLSAASKDYATELKFQISNNTAEGTLSDIQVDADIQHDKSICIEEDNSDVNIELLQCQHASTDKSPTKKVHNSGHTDRGINTRQDSLVSDEDRNRPTSDSKNVPSLHHTRFTFETKKNSSEASKHDATELEIVVSNNIPGENLSDISQATFIEEDDSDDIELLRSPFKPSNVSPTMKVSNERTSKRIQLSLDSSGTQHTSMNKSPTKEICNRQYRRSAGQDSQLKSEIVQILLSNPDISRKESDEEMCQMAAESAIAMHPNLDDVLELVEPAYALYLELTLP